MNSDREQFDWFDWEDSLWELEVNDDDDDFVVMGKNADDLMMDRFLEKKER